MSNAIDRRRILGGLAAIAAVPGCATSRSASAQVVPVASAGSTASAGPAAPAASTAPAAASKYPPLPPLGDATFARRHDSLRALARQAGASLVFVTSGTTSFAYLAGGRVERSERLIAVLLPVDGAPLLVAPAFEVERMRRQTRFKDVRPWEEHENPFTIARDALGAAYGKAKILIEPHTEYQSALALGRALPGATLVDGTAAFERLRLHKDDDELARIRRAVAVTQDVFDAAFAGLHAGVRDREVAQAIAERFRAAGYTGYALVQFGALSALPHGHPHGEALRDGTVVLIDGGCEVDGYWSDITRTRFFGGEPPAEFRKVHGIVHDAQSAALARVRPGVAAQDLDRAAREVIERAGFGARFTHRLGHGLGMDGHEPAYLVKGNAQPLEAGFVFTIEPGIYLPDQFGVRIEDDVACGPDGPIVLSRRADRMPA
ncbi:MAG: aminopeptidase P family protein [Deltaproteobacteria bacterium]|nr:MAG: aminopeptidase P family protein [Deltaproteobacteria bacterium]